MFVAFATLFPFRRAGSPPGQAGSLCYPISPLVAFDVVCVELRPRLLDDGMDGRLTTGMKDENPIEKVWRICDELSAEYGYDIYRIFAALREEKSNTQIDRSVW
jgi:hypothetical protein